MSTQVKKDINTKCGFISVIGKPNAGKSSLLNHLTSQNMLIVSKKANATRRRSNIIITKDDTQMVFIDTPGINYEQKMLDMFMLEESIKATSDSDVVLFLSYVNDNLNAYEDFIAKNDKKHIVLLSKCDMVTADKVAKKLLLFSKYNDKYEAIIPISLKNFNEKSFFDEICKHLPISPFLYDKDISSDIYLRDIYKELIRESLFDNLSDELPYQSDVLVKKVQTIGTMEHIEADIIINTQSQKAMIIGHKGQAIKRIGISARASIQNLIECKVFLKLNVSVKNSWFKDESMLKTLGYDISL
jgi:GTP-binding protein Era